MAKYRTKILTILCLLALLLCITPPSAAASSAGTIRVGWFPFTGYQEYNKDGEPYGYNYDYLMKIADFTGWNYEFVDATWPDCLTMLKDGQIDLVGCMLKTRSRTLLYDYPEIDCGTTSTSLFVRRHSPIQAYDFSVFDGLRIGCCMDTNNDEDFLLFAEENGFSATLIDYQTEPELLAAVLRGDVEAGIASSQLSTEQIRVVAGFAPAPFYFATTKGNTEALSGLNMAINRIKVNNSYYDKELAVYYRQSQRPSFRTLINQLPPMHMAIISAALFLLVLILLWLAAKRAQSLRTIQKLTYYDSLTGMYNKRGFEKRAKEILSKASSNDSYAVAAFDFDAFRHFNEFNGIAAGDDLLKAVATVSNQILCPDEVGARLSADDFVFLMRFTNRESFIHRIFKGDTQFFQIIHPHTIRIDYGVYLISDRTMDIQYMYDHAVFALQTVDPNSDQRIAFFDDRLYDVQKENAKILLSATQAFERKEFVVFYQPKYDTVSEVIVGAEALVRWKKEDGTIVSPGAFIELFEQNGYITKLDFLVFESVCETLAAQLAQNLTPVPVSVNFSRAHLFHPSFPDEVAELASRHHVPPHLLEIELTESAFTMESSMLSHAVHHLHAHGFSVAIDDFGSGYSSLGLLKDILADTLKLDMRFMDGFEKGGRVGTVVTAVVRMAKWLGMPVVAEGVETKEQVDFIRSVGGDIIQGYYYSKPLPLDHYVALLRCNFHLPAEQQPAQQFCPDDINLLMGGNRMVNYLLNGLCSGFALYEFTAGKLCILRVNDGYFQIMGASNNSMRTYTSNVVQRIYPEDQGKFISSIRQAVSERRATQLSIHRYNDNGYLMLVQCTILPINGDENSAILCISFHAISGTDDCLQQG